MRLTETCTSAAIRKLTYLVKEISTRTLEISAQNQCRIESCRACIVQLISLLTGVWCHCSHLLLLAMVSGCGREILGRVGWCCKDALAWLLTYFSNAELEIRFTFHGIIKRKHGIMKVAEAIAPVGIRTGCWQPYMVCHPRFPWRVSPRGQQRYYL